MSEKIKLCEFCEEEPASVLCSECCKCYCDKCSEYAHKKASKKEHKTETIPKGIRVNARCPIHKDNPLEMFCTDEVKLFCSKCIIKKLHKNHSVVDLSEVSEDNEIFSALEARKRFSDVLKYDDELNRKIENIIETIGIEGKEAKEKIGKTFAEAHEKLKKEEDKIVKELEKVCKESEEVLKQNLDALIRVQEYSKILSETDSNNSRMMELNIVSEMEKHRKEMEELHKMAMTDLKIIWDDEKRELSFMRTLFNGAPIPNNISFPVVMGTRFDISWERDESDMNEKDKTNTIFVVEVKKFCEEGRGWKEVYSGKEKKCTVGGLEKDTEYNVRVKCVIGNLQGMWSDNAIIKTKNVTIDSSILSGEKNEEVFKDKLSEWCGATDFELIYHGKRDGFGASNFHRTCDNKGKTLTLVKNTSGHIFGGFASIPWTSPGSGGNKRAPGSFIFTLTNMHETGPTVFHLKDKNEDKAVYHDNNYGPIFGENGRDFYIISNCNTSSSASSFPDTYDDPSGKGNSIFSSNPQSNNFQVQDIEVFRVNV